MKIDDLENYSLQLTERYQRFYYSAEAQLIKTEVFEYDLQKGIEIPTSCGFLEITDYIMSGDDIIGVYLDTYLGGGETKRVEVTLEKEGKIRLMEGHGTVYRVSDCTFKIIKK